MSKTEKQRLKRKNKSKELKKREEERVFTQRKQAKEHHKLWKKERKERNELARQTYLAQLNKLARELRKRMRIPEGVEYSLKELWAMAQRRKVDISDLIKKK